MCQCWQVPAEGMIHVITMERLSPHLYDLKHSIHLVIIFVIKHVHAGRYTRDNITGCEPFNLLARQTTTLWSPMSIQCLGII